MTLPCKRETTARGNLPSENHWAAVEGPPSTSDRPIETARALRAKWLEGRRQ